MTESISCFCSRFVCPLSGSKYGVLSGGAASVSAPGPTPSSTDFVLGFAGGGVESPPLQNVYVSDSAIVGSNLVVNFYPDSDVTGIVTTQIYSEIFQTESDFINIANSFNYGTILESYNIKPFNGRNGARGNILDFELKTDGTPIFQKTFDPTSSSILTLGTGTFTITNHFFKTGEKLNYLSASSFDGASSSDIQVSGAGNLPSEVYVIRVNDSQFRLATSKANAVAGTAVTFSSAGTGNAHTLEMSKRMEKTILTVDEVIQSPISYTKKQTDLFDNGGSINTTSTFFSVTGISSLLVGDLLKIDDEYIEVLGGLQPNTEYVTENSFLLKADVLKDGASHDH